MTLRQVLRGWYWALEERMLPGAKKGQDVYESVLMENLSGVGDWLDVGCGWHTLPQWRAEAEREAVGRVRRIVGVDLDIDSMLKHRTIRQRVGATMTQLPFADQSFDLVTANMVLEHLGAPGAAFREVCRVLRPGGRFVFHTPNRHGHQVRMGRMLPQMVKRALIQVLEGRADDDVFPALYRANDPATISDLAESSGLGVRDLHMILTHASFAAVLPIAVGELLWLRALRSERLRSHRPNIVGVLERT